uniref:Uncharacterized protein n=1 Tax=Neolamprologus brichardi TaxID=32507 RepID=A0A3Q4G6M8_NEOBR
MCTFPIQPSTKCWILNLVPSHQNTEKSCSIKLKASLALARRRTVNRNDVHGSKENIDAILYFIKDHMGQPEDCWNNSTWTRNPHRQIEDLPHTRYQVSQAC